MILKPAHAHDLSGPNRIPILVVEDNPETRLTYEKFLRNSQYQPILCGGLSGGRRLMSSSDQRRFS